MASAIPYRIFFGRSEGATAPPRSPLPPPLHNMHIYIYIYIIEWKMVEVPKIYIYIYIMFFNNTLNFKAQLITYI